MSDAAVTRFRCACHRLQRHAQGIIRSSADTIKRLTLELGGNDAGIVLPDTDPKAIAEGLFWGLNQLRS
jgi:acyl-CoA reductase-like NAD-dependent aldehyde dehydrogenase